MRGLRRETQLRIAPPVIEARVGHDNRIRLDRVRVIGSAPFAPAAANLEQIREIGGKIDLDFNALASLTEVAYRETFETRVLPYEFQPSQMDEVMLQSDIIALVQIGIRQVADQRAIVVAQC